MLRDYVRAFWRGVLHNKVATLINVGGLAIGLSVFFALSFYVNREFSWDAHWEDADRIFVPSGITESPTGTITSPSNFAPFVLGTSLQALRPDAVEVYARVYQNYGPVKIDGKDYPNQQLMFVEPSLLELIQLETLQGSLQDALADPGSIAINDTIAKRYFAETSPLGKTLTFTLQQAPPRDYVIRAVFEVPGPSVLGMQYMTLLEPTALPQPGARLDLWQFIPPAPAQPGTPPPVGEQPLNAAHYFKIRKGVDADSLEADLRAFMDEGRQMDRNNTKTRYVFRSLQDVHLMPSPFEPGDNVQRLWVYAAIGVLVLLISGCNFVMLATLRLVDRLREVGIRKTLGGGAGQLMSQYLLDAFLNILIAAVLAMLFLAFAFPKLQVMLELPLQLDLLNFRNIGLCLLMVVIFTAVSSAYPAWLTSRGKPGPLLRNAAGGVVATGTALRKLLVTLQFAIVVVLLLASAVVSQQIEYTRNRDPGYSMENVIAMRGGSPAMFAQMSTVLTEFNKVPGVEKAAIGGPAPGTVFITTGNLIKFTTPEGNVRQAALVGVSTGADYFDVMSVRVLAGREFRDADIPALPAPGSAPVAPQTVQKVVLNEAAARALGFATPEAAVDQLLDTEVPGPGGGPMRKQVMQVLGVVADTQFSSAMLPPVAQFYTPTRQSAFVAVKLAAGVDRATVTEDLKTTWDSIVKDTPFVPTDEALMTGFQLRREDFEARIVTGSALLAIVIALLGLYGLVAATVLKRVKEIGVRKVMGADRSRIVQLFLWQFSKPIAAANLLAWPFGFWAITRWLQRFPYQLDMPSILLSGLLASLVALIIAWLTVGAMAAKAASVKPVTALRYE